MKVNSVKVTGLTSYGGERVVVWAKWSWSSMGIYMGKKRSRIAVEHAWNKLGYGHELYIEDSRRHRGDLLDVTWETFGINSLLIYRHVYSQVTVLLSSYKPEFPLKRHVILVEAIRSILQHVHRSSHKTDEVCKSKRQKTISGDITVLNITKEKISAYHL